MGKRILVQRRGRGSPTFRANTHKRVAPARYPPPDGWSGPLKGLVRELVHDPGRGAPLALIELENGLEFYTVAVEGMYEGQIIEYGPGASNAIGNVVLVGEVPEGTLVCNLELRPGDGGKLARSSGAYATVLAHTHEGTMVKLPSGRTKLIKDRCRATVGVVAGGGRIEKPFLKAGKKFYWMRAKGRKWPRVRGVAMNACSHPFGGGRHQHPGRPTTVSRHAPPGAKVGHIAARATGRKEKKTVRKRG